MNLAVLEIKEKFIGKEYDDQEFNCATLVRAIYSDLGIDIIVDPKQLNQTNLLKRARQSFFENYHKKWKKVSDPMFPDVILFENKNGVIYHGGVMVGSDRVLHNCRMQGVIISKLNQLRKKFRINGFYRWKNDHN
jgi:cell wall-associated NlpC family hydrolase